MGSGAGLRSRVRPAVIASALVFALAGLMFTAAASASKGTDLRAERVTQLRDLVRQEGARLARLEQTVAEQQQVVDDLTEGRVGDPAALAVRAQVEALRADAGLTEVTGRGMRVTLDDAPLREPDDELWQTLSPNDVIVHQSDVEAVINAMWRGGADAIAVMGQRIVGTSSVQCVGNTLLLDGRVYSPPYVIEAIGPVKRMRASLRRDPGVADYRAWAFAVGLGYSVEVVPDLVIPPYDGPLSLQTATVPPGSSPTLE